jgi:nitrogen fixation protein FixH
MTPAPARKSLWIPWLFVAFFAVVFVVNGIMIYFATTTFSGLDRRDAYKRGLAYNEILAEARAQEALGWTAKIGHEPVEDAVGRLLVEVADDGDRPVSGAEVRALVKRPTNARLDFETWLVPTGAGRYAAELDWPALGVWDVLVTVRHGEDRYQLEERLVIR